MAYNNVELLAPLLYQSYTLLYAEATGDAENEKKTRYHWDHMYIAAQMTVSR